MKIKAILAVALLTVAATANAQFSNAGKSSQSAASASSYSSVYVQYDMGTFSVSDDGYSSSQSGWNGFSVGYTQGSSISTDMPLFLEYGAAFKYLSKSDKEDGVKASIDLATIKVPVNIAYRFAMPNGKFTVAPYAGANAKFHIFGNEKLSYKDESESASLFDGDDAAKRFQLGFQIGVNVDFGSAYVGVSYSKDITGLYAEDDYKATMGVTALTVGYNF